MRFLSASTLVLAASLPFIAAAQSRNDQWQNRNGDWQYRNDDWQNRDRNYQYNDYGDRTIEGHGVLRINGRTRYRPSVADVDLNNDGTFTIRVQGIPDGRFTGRWRRGKGPDLALDIGRALGDSRADGVGSIQLRGGGFGFTRVIMRGRANGDTFEVDIQRDSRYDNRYPYPDRGGYDRTIDTSERGAGLFQWRDIYDRINLAGVRLERNGYARVVLRGDREYEFKGRWRADSSGTIHVEISSGLGRSDTEGTVDIYRRGNSFDSVTASGYSRGSKFQAGFRAR